MGMELKVPALEKLLDMVASGIGSVAGPMLAPWKAKREGAAKRIGASADADVLLIHAEAQAQARELLAPHHSISGGELSISDRVQQRILFQEQKRQRNIESVVRTAAAQTWRRHCERRRTRPRLDGSILQQRPGCFVGRHASALGQSAFRRS